MVPTPPEQRMRLSLHRLLSFSTTVAATLLMFPVGAGAQDADDMAAGQSSYVGARLLQPETGIQIGGMNVGVHGDEEGRNRFMFWEGNSLFAGVVDEDVPHDLRVSAALPEVDAVFRQAGLAPEPGDVVVADDPAACLVGVDAARVAVVAHARPARVHLSFTILITFH